MREDYLKEAKAVISDPNVLINVVSRRVKQLKRGSRPLVESLEKLSSRTSPCARSAKAKSPSSWPESGPPPAGLPFPPSPVRGWRLFV